MYKERIDERSSVNTEQRNEELGIGEKYLCCVSLLSSMTGSYVVAYTYFIIKSVAPGTWKNHALKHAYIKTHRYTYFE